MPNLCTIIYLISKVSTDWSTEAGAGFQKFGPPLREDHPWVQSSPGWNARWAWSSSAIISPCRNIHVEATHAAELYRFGLILWVNLYAHEQPCHASTGGTVRARVAGGRQRFFCLQFAILWSSFFSSVIDGRSASWRLETLIRAPSIVWSYSIASLRSTPCYPRASCTIVSGTILHSLEARGMAKRS